MLPLACGTLGGLDHQTDRAHAEPRWREGLSLHEADSLARIVDHLTPRGLAGLPAPHGRLLVGVQSFREGGRQNCALGHRGGLRGHRLAVRILALLDLGFCLERRRAGVGDRRHEGVAEIEAHPAAPSLARGGIDALRTKNHTPECAPGRHDEREALDVGVLGDGRDELAGDALQRSRPDILGNLSCRRRHLVGSRRRRAGDVYPASDSVWPPYGHFLSRSNRKMPRRIGLSQAIPR
jgi:hypothetical protein